MSTSYINMNFSLDLIQESINTLYEMRDSMYDAVQDELCIPGVFTGQIFTSQEDYDEEEINWLSDRNFIETYHAVIQLTDDLSMYTNRPFTQSLPELISYLKTPTIINLCDFFEIDRDILTSSFKIFLESIQKNEVFSSKSAVDLNILQDFNHELMTYLTDNPELLFKVEPYVFEQVIAEIFKKFGMNIMLTKRTHDGGYDIVAFEETKYTNNKYIIECKRYHPNNKVGIDIVQRLYGIKASLNVTKAILVTSSTFSREAKKFAEQHLWELELKDYNDLVNWLKLYWNKACS